MTAETALDPCMRAAMLVPGKSKMRAPPEVRADRPLQAPDPMRQSGGEKSLTTMLFLLSLQQLTQCPFRVVDEINQGMDAHYERAIFERIVEWSSRDDTSQCFLITPKIQGGMLDNVGKHISVINIFKGSNMVMEGRL